MRCVVIESPYAGQTKRNMRYLRACMADCFARQEAPFASHGLYTQPGVLLDLDPAQRAKGITAGFAWRERADATVIYLDLGASTGMLAGVRHAMSLSDGHVIELRRLGGDWALTLDAEARTRGEAIEALVNQVNTNRSRHIPPPGSRY